MTSHTKTPKRMGNSMGKYELAPDHTLPDEGIHFPHFLEEILAYVLLKGWLILVMNWSSLIFGSSRYQ